MNSKYFKHLGCVVTTIVVSLSSQLALASSIITYNNSYGEGDYNIDDIYGNTISAYYGEASGGTVMFDQYSFPASPVNLSSGIAGGDTTVDLYTNDNYYGNGGAGATVDDPLNQLASIQIDGDSVVDFGFSIATPHTYTLTGNLSATGQGGHVSLLFDSVTLTDADTTAFNLTGTLAAGNYNFLIDSAAILTSAGSAYSNYDFNLQLTEVPIPAAAWLFGSGLIGLIGAARRRKISHTVS